MGQTTVFGYTPSPVLTASVTHATPRSGHATQRPTAHHPAGQQSPGVLLRGRGLPMVFAVAGRVCPASRVPGTCLRADDKPCASVAFPRPGRLRGAADEGTRAALRAIRQSHLPAQRHPMGRTVPVVSDAGGRLPARLSALHRTESGAG
jgi:hypothetical protein